MGSINLAYVGRMVDVNEEWFGDKRQCTIKGTGVKGFMLVDPCVGCSNLLAMRASSSPDSP